MVGRLLVNTVLILCVELPISDPLNDDLELGTNVDIETSPTPAPIEENKSNNDINYMTFFLNSERMPIQKSTDKKTPKKRQTGGIRKPRLTVKSKSSLGIKTAKSPRGKKPSVKNYLEKFEKELVLKKEMFEDRTSMIDGFLVTKLHTLDDSDGDVPHQGQGSDTINGNTSTSPIKSQGKTSIAGKTSKVRKSRSGPINSELLGVPLLEYGWWREIVYRRVSGNSVADVYYHSPQPFSKKFRSKVQISDELLKREYRERFPSLTDDHFTFSRVSLGLGEPYEIERTALERAKEVKKERREDVAPKKLEYDTTPTQLEVVSHDEWIGNLMC